MTRKTKKIKGGKFISEGSYGCVFGKPPLKCEGEPKRRTNKYVSKLSSDETANSEVNRLKILKSIDPTGEHFILPIDKCKLNRSSIEPTNLVNKCSKESSYDTLVFSKYGGKDLTNLKLPYDEYIPFFNSLVSVFEGIEKLHNIHYAHCDIKLSNILTQKQADNTFKTRLIDYDLLMEDEGLFLDQDNRSFFNTQVYPLWPLELHFATTYNFPFNNTIVTNFIDKWYTKQTNYGNYKSLPGKSYYKYNNEPLFNINSPEIDNLKKIDYSKYSLSSLDIFSLGTLLSQLFYVLIGYYTIVDENNTETVIINRKNIEKTDNINKKQLIEWHNNIVKMIYGPLLILIKGMIHINPLERLNIREVINDYKEILIQINILLTAEDLKRYLPPNISSSSEIMSLSPPPLVSNKMTGINVSRTRSRSRSRSRNTNRKTGTTNYTQRTNK